MAVGSVENLDSIVERHICGGAALLLAHVAIRHRFDSLFALFHFLFFFMNFLLNIILLIYAYEFFFFLLYWSLVSLCEFSLDSWRMRKKENEIWYAFGSCSFIIRGWTAAERGR